MKKLIVVLLAAVPVLASVGSSRQMVEGVPSSTVDETTGDAYTAVRSPGGYRT